MDEYQLEFSTGFGESYLNCPACGKEMITGHNECFSCGVVLKKFEDKRNLVETKASIGGIDHLTNHDVTRLDRKWKQVVVNYHDSEAHQEFLNLCQKQGAMPFAVHHYSKMLEIDKEDDIAQVMRRQALSRLTINFETEKKSNKSFTTSRTDRIIKWINWVGFFTSAAFIVTGALLQDSRNLIGLGVAMLSLFVALHLFRRR